ncbi:MAG TPA: beta-galactosidase [Bacteroidota bacterium]|nr:beta-galactosidase [Bacteroidota bacterium]
MKTVILTLIAAVVFGVGAECAQNKARHTFAFDSTSFVLDGKPFQIISGELHPNRIPAEYWRHRIRMAKAMGCNTIAAYIFWNFHEVSKGRYDFTTGNRNLARFLKMVQDEGMWVILRPGPYVCAEWDFGGIPTYLLKEPDIKVRCMDPRYMKAALAYLEALSAVVKPLQITQNGPVLMMQIENEYGSYGNDRLYMKTLKDAWRRFGITIPFFTGDGPTTFMLEAGSLEGCASGLDSGSDEGNFDLARKMNPGVPVFSSETYPGWLTHWGEQWARPDTTGLLKEVKFLMDTKKSFNFYVIHGGTNFGFTAGANSGGKGYEPDLTSYDYDAPITEQGRATPKYAALRALIGSYRPVGDPLPPVPDPIPVMDIADVSLEAYASIWKNLPRPIAEVQPKPFEAYDQNQGFILYKTKLIGHKSGTLKVTELHDYATVFLNGTYIGTLDRREGRMTIELPKSNEPFPVLEILVEGMGHINFAQELIDRKGITERVSLNGMTLMNWEIYKLPMDAQFIASLKPSAVDTAKPGIFFRGTFTLAGAADTFIDMSAYRKGVVWVNGHNLGRYWEIGPQKRLYCPSEFLKKGVNTILVFDQHQTLARPISGKKNLD